MLPFRRRAALAALAAAPLAAPAAARAQAAPYPSRPVRIVVPFPPGNMSDLIARVLQEEMQTRHGVQLVVDNRAGATGAIGIQAVTSSAPDGHTLLLSSNSPVVVNPALTPNLPFDVRRDLVSIALMGWTGFLVVVPPDLPARTLGEFVALARAHPGRFVAANPGSGTAGQLITEMFSRLTRTGLEQVSYRGSSQALLDIAQGRVHFMIDAMTSSLPQVQAGRVRALAVLSLERSPLVPDVPSVREAGLPEVADFQTVAWAGLMGPAGTPEPAIRWWNGQVNALLRDPGFARRLAQQNVEAAPPSGPERLADLVETDLARWTRLARDANLVSG